MRLLHDWARALECRDSCHCLCLDFAKAFDRVPRHRLLLKLQTLGISDDCFLTMQSQRVVVNGQYSEWLPVAASMGRGPLIAAPSSSILDLDCDGGLSVSRSVVLATVASGLV